MIRLVVLSTCLAAASPAVACPDYVKPEYCNRYNWTRPPLEEPEFYPPPRAYRPSYQYPIDEPPDTRFDSYRMDNAIRQIPNWNKQFPNYGR